MKINDEQLLRKIWINQLRNLCTGVILNYVGGRVGLCNSNEFWFQAASGESFASRSRVTDCLGKSQLLNRLRKLAGSGLIITNGDLTFWIENQQAWLAFNSAREFWLEHGVPEVMENGRYRTAKVDIESLSEKCFEILKSKFAHESVNANSDNKTA